MSERQTTRDVTSEEELRQRAMPRKNEADELRSNAGNGNNGDARDRDMNRDGDGRMSTADLAYGSNRATSDGTPRAETRESDQITLIQDEDAGGFRERWTSIQTKFIDEPRGTVGEADELVAEVIQSLARRFAEERQTLESQWQSGSEVSTEDLRLAMQHYRAFFERLLAA